MRMDTILIPAGEFQMGSDPHKDKDAYDDDEQPQHAVTLPDYYIGKTPVTNAQYLAFVEATGYQAPRHWVDGQIPAGEQDHPVIWVSLYDAVDYCQWLSEVTGKAYRLPTEAEWEKAARGTDGRIYPWGDAAPIVKSCNFDEYVGDTTPVGSYPRGESPYGCLDMAGNVLEWTSSLYEGYPYQADDGREDVTSSGYRVLRGGTFYDPDRFVRCASRAWDHPDLRFDDVGFRVARDDERISNQEVCCKITEGDV